MAVIPPRTLPVEQVFSGNTVKTGGFGLGEEKCSRMDRPRSSPEPSTHPLRGRSTQFAKWVDAAPAKLVGKMLRMVDVCDVNDGTGFGAGRGGRSDSKVGLDFCQLAVSLGSVLDCGTAVLRQRL
jgi:hypothetical protein